MSRCRSHCHSSELDHTSVWIQELAAEGNKLRYRTVDLFILRVVYKLILLNENCCILIQIESATDDNNNLRFVQLVVRHQTSDKLLTEIMAVYFTDATMRLSASKGQYIDTRTDCNISGY